MLNLDGTQTQKNLYEALVGESVARNKYTYFASKAKKEGYEQIAQIFLETAGNEKEHAKIWYKALYGIGNTKENLENAIEKEQYECKTMYLEFAKTAQEEGFFKIAEIFERVAKIECEHAKRYSKLLKRLKDDETFKSDVETKWRCLNCGFVVSDKNAPEICPVCEHKQAFFERIAENY